MSSFIIYDLETTGLDPAWTVPLQAALIHTDESLRPLSELSLRCSLPAHIVPSPGALLTTGIWPSQLEQAPMSSLDLLGQIARALRSWSPATMIGYNILRYDEEVFRHSFFSHLLPPYATQATGLKRADLLIMLRAALMLEPSAITVPVDQNGKRSLKLGAVCRANGVALTEDEAHSPAEGAYPARRRADARQRAQVRTDPPALAWRSHLPRRPVGAGAGGRCHGQPRQCDLIHTATVEEDGEVIAKKVAALTEALNQPDARPEAAEALWTLIEKIVLTPGPERGAVFATLHGELGTILDWTERQALGRLTKTNTPGAGLAGVSVSVVAGARFELTTFRL